MARIIYCHPTQTKYDYHIFTDLDFWDSRRLLKDLATSRRNFRKQPSGDVLPTQVVKSHPSRSTIRAIEKRLKKAIISPPRHVVVRSMVFDGYFEFDPYLYFPARWSREQMLRFAHSRLPLQQSSLCSPHHTVKLSWVEDWIRVERVQRIEKHDPVIRTSEEARRSLIIPACF